MCFSLTTVNDLQGLWCYFKLLKNEQLKQTLKKLDYHGFDKEIAKKYCRTSARRTAMLFVPWLSVVPYMAITVWNSSLWLVSLTWPLTFQNIPPKLQQTTDVNGILAIFTMLRVSITYSKKMQLKMITKMNEGKWFREIISAFSSRFNGPKIQGKISSARR